MTTMMTQANYRRMLDRDGGRCWHCGRTDTLVPQHRLNRGMGGSMARSLPSNIITLCAGFNGEIEANPEAAERARDMGWKLRPGTLPEAKAVYDMSTRRWYYLDDQWTRKDAFK